MTAPIIITGGTQRLGLAIATELLNQQRKVIVTYRTQKPAVDVLTQKGAKLIQADFSTDAGVQKLIDTLLADTSLGIQQYGVRAIIHNASDWDQEADTQDYASLFNKMMQVHASAPYQITLALKAFLKIEGHTTDIIHMTDYVQEKGSKKHIAYAASKAALHNLTLSFSALLAPYTKVNSIAPALVMFNDWDDEAYKTNALKKSLLEICPGPQEAVKAVNYLLTSEFMTGQTLHLDGGRHLK